MKIQLTKFYSILFYSILFFNSGLNAQVLTNDNGQSLSCCPDGFVYDGANCSSQVSFPDGFEPFFYEGAYYVQPNCSITTSNNCCPPGFHYDGANCHSQTYFPGGWHPFVWGNTFYVRAECCVCPDGYIYDGLNCSSGVKYPDGFNPFFYEGAFYVNPNCSITTANNCCPSGFHYDGANCHSQTYFPDGWNPFVWGNYFYVSAKCADHSVNDLCTFLMEEIDGRSDYNLSLVMNNVRQTCQTICFDAFCVPDRLVIRKNGVDIFDSGSLTNSCDETCTGQTITNCTAPLNSTCQSEESFLCFELSYDYGDEIDIIIDGNSCNMMQATAYEFFCESGCPGWRSIVKPRNRQISENTESNEVCSDCSTQLMYSVYSLTGEQIIETNNLNEVNTEFMSGKNRDFIYLLQTSCGGVTCDTKKISRISLQTLR